MEDMRENETKGTSQIEAGEPCSQAQEQATESPKLDGRLNRSVVTRNKIVETLTKLILEGQISPTAEQVALRANVGLRTVFRHFDNMDALYREISIDVDARLATLHIPGVLQAKAGPCSSPVTNVPRVQEVGR